MNIDSQRQGFLKRLTPPVAGVLFIAFFVKLGLWQLDRADYKNALLAAYENTAAHLWITPNLEPERYQALEVSGRYLDDRQVLIDNIVRSGRIGYFVVTPFAYSPNAPLLLVNRGWVPKDMASGTLPDMRMPRSSIMVRGRSGDLPKVGIRPGEAFIDTIGWPRIGVWPTIDEVADQLGEDVLPFVLLLDADEEYGFTRAWQPRQSGASTHYGYAVQWFAMAAAVLAILAWHFRHGIRNRE